MVVKAGAEIIVKSDSSVLSIVAATTKKWSGLFDMSVQSTYKELCFLICSFEGIVL